MSLFSPDHLTTLRADTPGVANRLHLNNAGAALMPRPVVDAMQEHLELEASIGGYEAAAAMRSEIADFFEAVARLIGARPTEIAYTGSATESYNRALSCIPWAAGDVLLTTTDDYVSNQIAFLQLHRRFGVQVLRAANRPEGGVDVQHMQELIDRHTPRLVAVTHVPTSSGLIQPVAEIGALCRARGVLYLIDACQSAGQLHLDVQRLGCDFLSATFRKFLRGPRGAGFLFVSERALDARLEPLFLDLHSAHWTDFDDYEALPDARRFELWERPYALVLGARAAVDYACELGSEAIESRVRTLGATLRAGLSQIAGIRVLDRGADLGAIVTLTAEGITPKALKAALDRRHINTSLTFRDAARFDFHDKNTEWALRASPHYYTTESEIETFLGELNDILRK